MGRLSARTGEAVAEVDRLRARNTELESILKETVELYGKPGGPWNIPPDPGGWIEKARKALGNNTKRVKIMILSELIEIWMSRKTATGAHS